MANKPSILAALEAVTEADLVAIDAQIAEHEKALTSLREARKIVVARVRPEEVKRPGGWGKRRKKSDAGETVEVKAPGSGQQRGPVIATIKNLLEVHGPLTMTQLLRNLKAAGFDTITEHGVKIAIGHAPDSVGEDAMGRYMLRARAG